MGTRALLGFGGIGLFALNLAKNFEIRLHARDVLVWFFMIGVSVISAVAVLMNGTTDLAFVKYPISITLITFGAYFVVKVLSFSNKEDPVRMVIDTLIAVIVAQDIIAVLMFAFPALMNIANQLQSLSSLDEGLLGAVEGARIVGFGSKFFEAGIINGYGLMLIIYRLCNYQCTALRRHLLSISFILLALIGVMMARTTLIGIFLALVLCLLSGNTYRNKKTFYAYLVIVPGVLYGIYIFFLADSNLKAVVEFGFELFLNMSENGKVESKSTNQLLDMYSAVDNLPLSIGAGYFGDPLRPEAYYKAVDVGYLRLILYFGLPGLVVFFLFQLYFIYYSLSQARIKISLILILIGYSLLLNMKGLFDFYYLIVPFWLVSRTQDEKSVSQSVGSASMSSV